MEQNKYFISGGPTESGLTSSSSADAVTAYTTKLCERFCEALDLEILDTLDQTLTYGGKRKFIGYKKDGKDYPLLAIAPSQSSGYFYRCFTVSQVCYEDDDLTNLDAINYTSYTATFTETYGNSNTGVSLRYYIIGYNLNNTTSPLYLSVIKGSTETKVCFFHTTKNFSGTLTYPFVLMNVTRGIEGDEELCLFIHESYILSQGTSRIAGFNNYSYNISLLGTDRVTNSLYGKPTNGETILMSPIFLESGVNPRKISDLHFGTNLFNYSTGTQITINNHTALKVSNNTSTSYSNLWFVD